MKITLLTALGAVALSGGAFAQGSDACAGAQAINGAGTFNYNNSAASTDGAPNPLCYKFGTSQIDNDVWFVWTAATTGAATVSMCGGAGNDTKIAIYSGPGCASTMVDCNDDTCGLQSEVTNGAVVAGSSYLIRIGSFPGGSTGAGTFDITNTVGGCVGGNGGDNACSNAEVIVGCCTFAYDNTAATQDGLGDPMCYKFATSQIDADVWFSWTAPNTGSFTATTCGGAGNDTKMAVYADTGICPPSPALDCNDDTCGLQSEITWNGTAGASYLIRIGSFPGGSTGAGTFDITGCSAAGPGTNYCATSVNSTGAPGTISGTGSASIGANDLTLIASSVPQIPGIGIFIAGPTSAQIPLFNGFLCVAQIGLQRINQITAPVGGVVTQAIDYTGASTGTAPLNVVAGASYFYQFWMRDPAAGGANVNLTDGYEIVHTP